MKTHTVKTDGMIFKRLEVFPNFTVLVDKAYNILDKKWEPSIIQIINNKPCFTREEIDLVIEALQKAKELSFVEI